jgi:hypothetical protein
VGTDSDRQGWHPLDRPVQARLIVTKLELAYKVFPVPWLPDLKLR